MGCENHKCKIVDVNAWIDLSAAGLSDDIADTVSYTDIYRIVKNVVEGPSQNLLESVTHLIANTTLIKFPQIAAVRVKVRREKISQRMKLLQDLVPGCNKVVGKAVMLDEIINYVQSLQRQVEFLSMKLATVNPQLDFNNLPSLLTKDMQQACAPLLNSSFPLDTSGSALPFTNSQQQANPLHFVSSSPSSVDPHNTMHPFFNAITDAASQLGAFWHDDLQNVVQMDIRQNQEEIPVSSQAFNGTIQQAHMKMEL